jgi:hypothetical protein
LLIRLNIGFFFLGFNFGEGDWRREGEVVEKVVLLRSIG